MIALEAGAEDVKAEEEGFEIVTEPEDFDAVEKALADNNIEVMMSEIAMLPDTMAELSDEDVVKVRKMLEALEDFRRCAGCLYKRRPAGRRRRINSAYP